MNFLDDEDDISSMSTGDSEEDEIELEDESVEEKDDEDLKTVPEDDDERRLEVLKIMLTDIQSNQLFDKEDAKAILKEIKKMENSKKRLWRKQCKDRLKVLSEYERVLKLHKHHPELSNFFVSKHRKMERMVASLK